jgi:hypothetical protein
MCGAAWLVPPWTFVPPVWFPPVLNGPGAKIAVFVEDRWEKLATRSGAVVKSIAPLAQSTRPTFASYDALTASALASAAGYETPCVWKLK